MPPWASRSSGGHPEGTPPTAFRRDTSCLPAAPTPRHLQPSGEQVLRASVKKRITHKIVPSCTQALTCGERTGPVHLSLALRVGTQGRSTHLLTDLIGSTNRARGNLGGDSTVKQRQTLPHSLAQRSLIPSSWDWESIHFS